MNVLISKRFLLAVLATIPMLFFAGWTSAEEVVTSGTFTGASGHKTSGSVRVIKTENGMSVVLGANFFFDGAPDPKVGFGKSSKYDINSQLAHLKSDSGEQSYPIPASLDVTNYNQIYIWCEKYSVPLGVADLN